MRAPRVLAAALAAASLWGCGFYGERANIKDVIQPEQPTPLLSDGSTKVQYDELFEYKIGNGDSVQLAVTGHDELSGPATVDERGRIAIPSTDKVIAVAGLTLGEVEGRIGETISPYCVGQPKVHLRLTASRSKYYYVLGGVWAPGIYNMGARVVRLREALSAAGLFREYRADQRRIGVITPDPVKPTYVVVNGREALMGGDRYNVVIKPGDVIFVQDRIIYDLDWFLFALFRETENASTTNKAVKFWEDAVEGKIGTFTYPRDNVILLY